LLLGLRENYGEKKKSRLVGAPTNTPTEEAGAQEGRLPRRDFETIFQRFFLLTRFRLEKLFANFSWPYIGCIKAAVDNQIQILIE
jgi:hypothetical protein